MTMTNQQIKFVRVLLSQRGLTEEKESIVMDLTNGRTGSLKELNKSETIRLIEQLNMEDVPRKKMVNKILALAHEMHWEDEHGKVDMKRINNWLLHYTKYKKTLNQLENHELGKVIVVFERVYQTFLNGLKK